jgi:predicted nucleic acid-binding Zn ribbon protein
MLLNKVGHDGAQMAREEQPDEPDDWELPDPEDVTDEDDPTYPCPYCRKPIHEESEWCHHCGQYLSEEDQPGRTGWMVWVVVVVVALTVLGLAAGWLLR